MQSKRCKVITRFNRRCKYKPVLFGYCMNHLHHIKRKNEEEEQKMSWTDRRSIEVINYLKRKFDSDLLVETGTFKGINAWVHSKTFKRVITIEKDSKYVREARERLIYIRNVSIIFAHSPDYLRNLTNTENTVFYLDAHFYDKNLPQEKRFVVKEELDALESFGKCIIVIHDFDNNLGHITYDGQTINMDMVRKRLLRIYPEFNFYTNELASCSIVTPNTNDMERSGLPLDKTTRECLEYAWREPRLTYRGILYAVPFELKLQELKDLGLRRCN